MEDIYYIKSSSDKVIIYSPLRRYAFHVEECQLAQVKKCLAQDVVCDEQKLYSLISRLKEIPVIIPNDDTVVFNHNHLIILLTQKCNLGCTYCYAQYAKSNKTIKPEQLWVAIDYVLQNTPTEMKRFTFAGGGEPLVEWDLLRQAILYIKERCSNVRISVITNGTLLNKDRIYWLKEHDVTINISFDVLPEIQNRQRPMLGGRESFSLVSRNIKDMISLGLEVPLRITISKDFVHRMPNIVEFVYNNFPATKILNIWPVIDVTQEEEEFYEEYINYFFEAKTRGFSYGIHVVNWLTVLNKVHSRFCQEDFSITPNGKIVTCLRASSYRDKFYDDFYIGDIKDRVCINQDKMNKSFQLLNSKLPECQSCFAKWSCAGICPNTRLLLNTPERIEKHCSFVRKFICKNIEWELLNNDGVVDYNK